MTTAVFQAPEQRARQQIDRMLGEAGWSVQNRSEMNLAASPGVAVREFQTRAGPADYLLFLGNRLVGVIEAKKVGALLSEVEAQTDAYASAAPVDLQVPVRPLPFRYESTGVETWFTNGLDPTPTSRRVFSFHRPETLGSWLEAEQARREGKPGAPTAPTLQGRMRLAPPLDTHGMWPAQIRAVENLEKSFREGRRRALIQMATGSGKTFTAISAIYRLVDQGRARRVLFLVDRGNLGRQALKEFQDYTTPDDGRKFTELYNVVNLGSNVVEPVNKVVISTIQRLYSMLQNEPALDEEVEEASAWLQGPLEHEAAQVSYNPALPPDFFDVIVIDECHRSIYSLWRQVLEYFDATLIGLTATPGNHTYGFFEGNVVSEYPHEQAVRDGVNVPFSVYEIRTEVTERGATIVAEPGVVVGKRDRLTRAQRWEELEEDLTYESRQLDRSVVVKDQIRTVLRTFREKLFTEIFPGRTEIPKTLIFAKSDDHAEDILRILREDWPLSNEQAVKITYRPERQVGEAVRGGASHRPEQLIQAFRNSYNPRVAVTVDMIATGTDIKPLECVVFLRSVKSRALFEQMKGRGVRVMPDADFRHVTRDAKTKTHFVVVDCVGVMEETKADPPLERDRSVPFGKLIERVAAGNRDEDVLSTLAARLVRMERQLDEPQRAIVEKASGGASLRNLIAGIIDRLDPDREIERARSLHGLPPGAEPTEEQIEAARAELREEAAAPIAYNPPLRTALLDVRRAQEVTIDVVTRDEVVAAGPRKDLEVDYDAQLVSAFESFCKENRDELAALTVLYSRPWRQRLTRPQLMELLHTIQAPPRQWTTEKLWKAYERVERDRVRGAGAARAMTDLISLARHALGVEDELVPWAEVARERYRNWLAQQENGGRSFTPEQREILDLIVERIVVDYEVRTEDFDDPPFAGRGGLGMVWSLFGEELESIVRELNEVVAA